MKTPKSRKGTDNANAKLTEDQVRTIHSMAARDDLPVGWMSKLARKWGVSSATITYARKGVTWAHLLPSENNC